MRRAARKATNPGMRRARKQCMLGVVVLGGGKRKASAEGEAAGSAARRRAGCCRHTLARLRPACLSAYSRRGREARGPLLFIKSQRVPTDGWALPGLTRSRVHLRAAPRGSWGESRCWLEARHVLAVGWHDRCVTSPRPEVVPSLCAVPWGEARWCLTLGRSLFYSSEHLELVSPLAVLKLYTSRQGGDILPQLKDSVSPCYGCKYERLAIRSPGCRQLSDQLLSLFYP